MTVNNKRISLKQIWISASGITQRQARRFHSQIITGQNKTWNGMPDKRQGYSQEPSFTLAYWRQSVHFDVSTKNGSRSNG